MYNRFDIIIGYWFYFSSWHNGQSSKEYSRLSKLLRYFTPSLLWSKLSDLPEGAIAIYTTLLAKNKQIDSNQELIYCYKDYIGYIIEPCNSYLKDRIIVHLKNNGVDSDGTVYLQSLEDLEEIGLLSTTNLDEASKGWDVYQTVDTYEFLNCFGYDTKEIIYSRGDK